MTPYQRLLTNPRWQQRRLEIMARDAWQCKRCGTTTQELQVHHRWYERGRPPWGGPLVALVTLCADCHHEVSMHPTLPALVKQTGISGDYGRIRAAWSADRKGYVVREDMLAQVSQRFQHDPDRRDRRKLLTDYLVAQDGNNFRSNLARLYSGKGMVDIDHFLEFDDAQGVHWWIMEIGVNFAAKYDDALYVLIIHHFVETGLVLRDAPPPLPAKTVASSMPSQGLPLEAILAMVQAQIQTRDTLGQHDRLLDQHTQQLSDLESRSGARPGEMILREFVLTRLRRHETTEQLKEWGIALGPKKLRKVWDAYSSREVNVYRTEDLETFFRSKGLLT